MRKKEQETVKELLKEYFEHWYYEKEPGYAYLHYFFRSIERMLQARATYQVLKASEINLEETIKKYKIDNSFRNTGGLSVDLNLINQEIWIPEIIIEKNADWKESFDILNQDECSSFYPSSTRGSKDFSVMFLVLYCKSSKDIYLGDKLKLFSESLFWRNSAKKYCRLLVKSIIDDVKKKISKKNHEFFYLSIVSREEYEKEMLSLTTIKKIANFYLKTMKL